MRHLTSYMVSAESPQTGAGQAKSSQAGATTTVPFEVVRRTEFVFEPFLGSLIQLPEAGPPQAQNSENFLPYTSPVQVGVMEAEAWLGEVVQVEVEQVEVVQPEALQEPMLQAELGQAEVLHADVLQAEIERAEVLQPEVSQEEILQAALEHAEVSQEEVLQEEILQAALEQETAPEIASAVEMKAPEESAASAAADKIDEIFAKPAQKVVNAPRLTPLVQEQWQIAEAKPREKKDKPSLAKRVGRWLWDEVPTVGGTRRRAERRALPGLRAFYWSGGTPRPHEVVNISKTGFYMRTTELWSVETLVRMTLQRPRPPGEKKLESVSVLARVVRIDEGGVGHEFVTTEALRAARSLDVMPSQGTNAKELDRFLEAG